MDYQPNVDAVLWFSEKVLPLLPSDLKFFIIGANPTKKVKKLAKKYQNVVVTGFVEDPYEILKSSLCVVSPMQTGGGIQNKVLESMALGTINILSSIAARPIGAKNGEEYLVIDHPEQMGEEICKIWKNPSLYSHFRQKSRDFIARNFTWERYEEILIQNLFELIEKEKNDSEI
jgi:glycosyltransferase involved in cell wall biosynthesis